MNKLLIAALVILLTAATGCSPGIRPENAPDDVTGMWVPVNRRGAIGSGAVVGKHLIATVDHVYNKSTTTWTITGNKAREVLRFRARGYEEIVILRTRHEFSEEEIFKFPSRGDLVDPETIWTSRGAFSWWPSKVIPGDSGSPVLNASGRLLGHVSARNCRECLKSLPQVYEDQISIGSWYPYGFSYDKDLKALDYPPD